LVGAGHPQTVALGDTTNVAARIQSSAEPGTIAVSESTANQLSHRFVVEPVGEQKLKGRQRTTRVWRLKSTRPTVARSSAVPLVGRQDEVARVASVMRELEEGRGQALILLGEPGIGKSRLLAELGALASSRVTRLHGGCVSYGGAMAYAPFVEALRSWLGVTEGEPEISTRTKFRARITSLGPPARRPLIPVLGHLLSLSFDATKGRASDDEQDDVASQVREAWVQWIEALAIESPVVLEVEDIHWADPATRELLEHVLELCDRLPLLIAMSLAPEPGSEGWRLRLFAQERFHHRTTEIALRPLHDEDMERFVDALVSEQLDQALRREIVARAEGNPLYAEQMLRTVTQSEGMWSRSAWTLSKRSPDLLPPALEALLVARIDQLHPEARTVAQVAAVIGRDFPASVLQRVVAPLEPEPNLTVLLRSDIVRELHRYPEAWFSFRHGLLQEAALSTLTSERLTELYGRVAKAFEEVFADSLDDRLEQLAFYFYRSRHLGRALHYLERAADKNAALQAIDRARDLAGRALKVATVLGDTEAEKRLDRSARSM